MQAKPGAIGVGLELFILKSAFDTLCILGSGIVALGCAVGGIFIDRGLDQITVKKIHRRELWKQSYPHQGVIGITTPGYEITHRQPTAYTERVWAPVWDVLTESHFADWGLWDGRAECARLTPLRGAANNYEHWASLCTGANYKRWDTAATLRTIWARCNLRGDFLQWRNIKEGSSRLCRGSYSEETMFFTRPWEAAGFQRFHTRNWPRYYNYR